MFVRVLISVDGLYAPAPISGSVACLLARLPAWRMLPSTAHLAGGSTIRAHCDRLSFAACRPEERGGYRVAPVGPGDFQGGGSGSPEITPRSQAWTAPTTSCGLVTARGIAEPAIQSEITVMRARNWPSASTEARMTKILVRRAGLAS